MFRITHGNQLVRVVTDAAAVGKEVAAMVEEGRANILVTRDDSDLTVTQIDRPDPLVPVGALTMLRFDVIVPRG